MLSALRADLGRVERLRLAGYKQAAGEALDVLDAELNQCSRALAAARRSLNTSALDAIPEAPGEDPK